MGGQRKAGIILSYLSFGLNMLIELLYTPIMIRLLGQSEYGLYTLVGSVVSYLSLFSLGFTGAYLRFHSRYEHREDDEAIARLNGMFLSIFLVMGCIALVCGMVLAQFTPQLFGDNLSSQEWGKASVLMEILVINIALTFPTSVFDSIVSAHEKFLFQRVVKILGIICNPFIALPLLLSGYGSVAIVSVTTIVTIVKLISNVFFCSKVLKVPFLFRSFDFSLLREIAGFSFFLFLNMIIDQINWSVDKFILGRVSGTKDVAVYGVGAQINALFISFSTAISSVFAPVINKIAADTKAKISQEYTKLFIRIGRIQFLVLMLFASGFVVFGKYFITHIYVTQEYEQAYYVALFLVLPAMIPLIQNLGMEMQRALNKHKVRSIIYFGMAIINIGMSVPLAVKYGPIGTAIGTAISLIVGNGIIMNVYYKKAIEIDIVGFWKNIFSLGKAMILPIILGIVIITKIDITRIGEFILLVMIYAIVYIVSFWYIGMNRYEKDLVIQMITRVSRIIRRRKANE